MVPDSFLEQITVSKREASFCRLLLNDSPEETHVAEERKEVLGFLTVGPCRDADANENDTGEIWGIYIAPTNPGQASTPKAGWRSGSTTSGISELPWRAFLPLGRNHWIG